MTAKRPVADDDELRLAVPPADFLKRFDERGESIARIESPEEENDRDIGADAGRAGDVRIEDVGVDAVRNDRPVRLEIPVERDRRRV
jgi:hypothetical protein